MPQFAPQFTLHDERHLVRVTDLAGEVLGQTANRLNAPELALLILSAFYHDQGMVPDADEYRTMRASDEYRLHRGVWLAAHPNYGEIERQALEQFISTEDRRQLSLKTAELEQAIFTDYLRRTHATRSSQVMLTLGGADPHLSVGGVNLAGFAARLCESHTRPVSDVTPENGFLYDEQVGRYSVNMAYLALVLRLADILDFDRDRAPDVLYRTIHFTDDISLIEWEKTRSVDGWQIDANQVRFTVRCTHPVYEKAVREYMDAIDRELGACVEAARAQPERFGAYRLDLPPRVLRDRIGPRDSLYLYYDLGFKLERDDIVDLLMGENLYGGAHLCVRELVQNSLDALRYRRAILKSFDSDLPDGRIALTHTLDANGYEVLECRDNGVGMDEDIIVRYFARVGKSFYRSPEFEAELVRLEAHGLGFDPCSRFGIGFMSCFMVGDRVRVSTRKDYGPTRGWGTPLEVEINGLGGLIVIRRGDEDQEPGTTVSVTSRKRPFVPDKWADEIRLTTVLRGYMLATEFPITGECSIPGIEDQVEVPTTLTPRASFLEREGVSQCRTLVQQLSEIDQNLRGYVREAFLVSSGGTPCLANDEGSWVPPGAHEHRWHLRRAGQDKTDPFDTLSSTQVCVDGVLVGGIPGRPGDSDAEHMLGWRNPGIYATSSVLADARGGAKPELSPARLVPDAWSGLRGGRRTAGWQRLEALLHEAQGRVWEQLCAIIGDAHPSELIWQLSAIYGQAPYSMRSVCILNSLNVPLVSDGGDYRWCRLRDVGPLAMRSPTDGEQFELVDSSGWRIDLPPEVMAWEGSAPHPSLRWTMNVTALAVSRAELDGGRVLFSPSLPDDPSDSPQRRIQRSPAGPITYLLVPYSGELRDVIAVGGPFRTANSRHPLVALGHSSRFSAEPSSIEEFACAITSCASWMASDAAAQHLAPGVTRIQKWVGHLYTSVEWERFDVALKPPYKYWTSDGTKSIQERDLIAWRGSRTVED